MSTERAFRTLAWRALRRFTSLICLLPVRELIGIGRPSPGTGPRRTDPSHLSQRPADVVAVLVRQLDELVEDSRLVALDPRR